MIVRIENELFLDASRGRDLNYLLQTLIRRGHTPDFAVEMLEKVEGLHENDMELLEEFAAGSLIGDARIPHCVIRKDASDIHDKKVFGIEEGQRYVETPLEVIVENNNNDSKFILRVLDVYTSRNSIARNAYASKNLTIGNAGGCGNVCNYLKEKLAQNGGRHKFLRHFVIWDGDRKYPGHIVDKYEAHKAYLDSIGVGYHILEKRCMENYLPLEAFPDRECNADWINAYSALTHEQRDYINIGGGFRDDVGKSKKHLINAGNSNVAGLLEPGQQAFYSGVPARNFQKLVNGYNLPAFKDNFPEGFTDGCVNRSALDKIQSHHAGDPKELEHLAAEIERLL